MTPNLKCPNLLGGKANLLFIDLGVGKAHTGGSSLVQMYGQIGNESPDVKDFGALKNAFLAVQESI